MKSGGEQGRLEWLLNPPTLDRKCLYCNVSIFFVSSDGLIELQFPDLSMGGVGMTQISHNSVSLKNVLSTEY